MMSNKTDLSLWHSIIYPIISYFRKKRGKKILQIFPEIRKYKICDIGGSKHFWDHLALDVPLENINIYNISDSETQSVSGNEKSEISFNLYDGLHVPVADGFFDLVICNSVIEHVPLENRKRLCQEIQRISPRIFLQTPAYFFPVEPHFILPFVHWLPKSIGRILVEISPWRLLSKPPKEEIDEYLYGTNLLTKSSLKDLFPSLEINVESFALIPKSYYVIKR